MEKKPKTVPKMNFQFDLDAEMVSLKSKLSALIMFFKGMNEFFYNNQWAPEGEEFYGIALILEEMAEQIDLIMNADRGIYK